MQKREKDVNCPLEIILGIPKTRGYRYDARITLTAPAKRIGALGTSMKIDQFFKCFFRSCAVRFAIVRTFPREILHYVSGFQFAHKSFHRCVLCSNFRMTLFVLVTIFCVLVFMLLCYLYDVREVRKVILSETYLCTYFHYVIYSRRCSRNFWLFHFS